MHLGIAAHFLFFVHDVFDSPPKIVPDRKGDPLSNSRNTAGVRQLAARGLLQVGRFFKYRIP